MNDQTRTVRVTFDEDSDAAYVYLTDESRVGGVTETVPVDPLDGMG